MTEVVVDHCAALFQKAEMMSDCPTEGVLHQKVVSRGNHVLVRRSEGSWALQRTPENRHCHSFAGTPATVLLLVDIQRKH